MSKTIPDQRDTTKSTKKKFAKRECKDTGRPKSKFEDLQKYPIGMQFNDWTRISDKICRTKRNVILFEVRCKCGKIKFIKAINLGKGYSSSCGSCCKKQEKHVKWTGIGPISGSYIHKIKRSAIRRDHEYNITKQDLLDQWNKQSGKCAFSGIKLDFPEGSGTKTRLNGTASVDRIDSSRGYIKDNIQFVHQHVNYMKQDMIDDEFINWCELIIRHRKPELFK